MLLCARTCLVLEEEAVGKIERLGVKGALAIKTFQTISAERWKGITSREIFLQKAKLKYLEWE